MDLSQIDFEKLRDEFASKVRRKHAALQDIREVVEKKLAQMLARNPMRMDYYKKYQEIIADYNREKDRVTVEATFAQLVDARRQPRCRATACRRRGAQRRRAGAVRSALQGQHQQGRSGAAEAGEQGAACVAARVAPAHARLDAEHDHPGRGQGVHPRQPLARRCRGRLHATRRPKQSPIACTTTSGSGARAGMTCRRRSLAFSAQRRVRRVCFTSTGGRRPSAVRGTMTREPQLWRTMRLMSSSHATGALLDLDTVGRRPLNTWPHVGSREASSSYDTFFAFSSASILEMSLGSSMGLVS